jgi:hypothetical protein
VGLSRNSCTCVCVCLSVHNTDCIYPQPLYTSNSISFHTSWNIKPA